MGAIRGGLVLSAFLLLTLPLMPVQALLKRTSAKAARMLPHWYHRQVCRLLGLRLSVSGRVEPDRPVLLVANHTSWLDIPVISAVVPVSFVAKKEVSGWPGVSALARLQQTVFVNRERRSEVGRTTEELMERLKAGSNLVLFAEGTSTDGNRVLPFKTSLFAAVKPPRRRARRREDDEAAPQEPGAAPDAGAERREAPCVQTLTLLYTHVHGVPLSRADRHLTGWYGDMDMLPHAWQLLKSGPLDVSIVLGEPIPLDDFEDRKALARHTEDEIRETFVSLNRGGRAASEAGPVGVQPGIEDLKEPGH